LEDLETVSLNTDIVGSNNIAGTPFPYILLTGENSGIGSLQTVTVNTGGTLYANGGLITFTGGGESDGEPWLQANAYITTDGSGVITTVIVTNPGEGYYTAPTLTLPATSGTVANLSPVMSYGYGFVNNPLGNIANTISSLLTYQNFTIGSIASLDKINPGLNYNANPYVRVYNPFVSAYAKVDIFLRLDNIIGSFIVGETIEQIIDGSTTATGRILEYNFSTRTIKVRRTSFNIPFVTGIQIRGETSNTTSDCVGINLDNNSRVLGDNADISANVIITNGVVSTVQVIDSGFGYVQDGHVMLQNMNNSFVLEGITNVLNQGKGSGYWKTTTSHSNSEKKIQDNRYYQEYSYDIISGLSINRYEDIVKKILHVAGNKMFGSVEKRSTANLSIAVSNSSITLA
jgi:hypothetical protein